MRDLAIAYGNNRQAKKWVNKKTKYADLKERLKVTIRTTESAEEYAKMSKSARDAAKDHGGFVGGVLAGGRRKVDTVESRSMIALDGDRIDTDFLDNYETNAPYTSFLYTTHSHTPDNPRVRLIFPLTRDITAEEFVAVSRYLAQMLGIDYFDECSYQPNQLMYWPSSPQNGVFVFREVEKAWLNPDDILSAHPEWTDPTRLPTSSRESKANQITQQKVQDPLTKEGTVGLFNRVFFPVTRALDTFLSDIYEATDNENRYHLIAASSMAGVEIKDDKFVYSHHAKDPAYLKLCNAFDIVRIHKFGDLDEKASFKEMCEFAMQQDEVKLQAANERLAEAEADFTVTDDDWKKRLKYQPKTSMLENSVYNLNLILANDPDFANFAFNEMANRIQVTGPLPWERPEGNQFWRDADTAQLKSIIDIRYLPFSSRNHDVAFTKIADDRHFHPIRDYLNSLPQWDGIERVEDIFIKYLQADDTEYVRTVTRKTFAAAVARIYVPGTKFDCVPVLDGDQGIGKSTIVAVFFEKENINTLDAKGEVLMTIMAALAQQESESLSANVRLGIQFRNQQGKVQINHNWFLGYTKDENGKLIIVPEEAAVVQRIYAEYLDGRSFLQIKRGLEADGVLNGAGHQKWHESNIKQILTNEKYIGDALLQKTYTVNTLEKKRVNNNGIAPKYYVEGSHEAIIDKDVFLRVQAEIARRANILTDGKKRIYSSRYALSSIVFCGHCGDIYRRIKWNNRGCKSTVWRCVSRVLKKSSGIDCPARTIHEEVLQAAVVTAVNDAWSRKDAILPELRENIRSVLQEDTDVKLDEIDAEIKKKQTELLDAGKDQNKIDEIGDAIMTLREKRQTILTEAAMRKDVQDRIEDLASFLEGQIEAVTEYSDALVRRLIEKITVCDEKLIVEFKSGLEVEVDA